MNYQKIKLNLSEAGRRVDAGDLHAADLIIRSMVGQGMTRADMDVNLTSEQIRKLREFAKSKK
jgi:hypothetical protein